MRSKRVDRLKKRMNEMFTIKHFSLILLLVFCLGCSTSTSYVSKKERVITSIPQLFLSLDMAEEMDFMGSRLLPESWTAANVAAIFGGEIGARIATASIQEQRASEDKIVSDKLNSKVRTDFKGIFLENLQEDLKRFGKVEKIEIVDFKEGQQDNITKDLILQISIPSWGLKKTQDESLLKVFADTRIRFKMTGQNKMEIEEQQVVNNTVKRNTADYVSDVELLNKDIEDMLKKASQRVVEVVFK